MASQRFLKNVQNVLNAYSDRKRYWKLAEGWELFPAAKRVIDEFSGLAIGIHHDPDLPRCPTSVSIDPNSAVKYFLDDESPFTLVDGTKLYPLGLTAENQVFMFIDEKGVVYGEGVRGTHMIAPTFDQALIRLINGETYWQDKDAKVHIPRRPFES
ncbi:MAG: SUKH-3 domain-containing protein [Candidatus Methylacidiphilales bacterium]|nr:SUKH-3 domain-containing protein [Candidatus Methylacidiphilales bacterium]